MNRNKKIALGCGGAGCLGLIVVVIVVVGLSAAGYLSRSDSDNRNRNYNFNVNSNANQNSNSDHPSSSSTMSNDDKHKLFQAVHETKDDQLLMKVLARIGFPNASGEGYDQFMEEHVYWALKNFEFMDTVNTPEKGRAYVEAHLDD